MSLYEYYKNKQVFQRGHQCTPVTYPVRSLAGALLPQVRKKGRA